MKNPFKKTVVRKSRITAQQENVYIPIPSQALKSWRYFDRFDINLYKEFLNCLNAPYEAK